MYKRQHMARDAARMREIHHFVLEIFHYFAQNEVLQKKNFIKFMGRDGQWFAECYARREKLQKLLKALEGVALPERAGLYEAMRTDALFPLHEGDEAFVFQESRLDRELVRTAAELTAYLYEEVFAASGFPSDGDLFRYGDLKKQLGEANGRYFCPVCLRNEDNLEKTGHIDHFFPKMKYPALTFHPENLTLICMQCNGNIGKGAKNPMDGTNLTELYLPYVRGAEGEMRITVQTGGESGHEVRLQPDSFESKTAKRIGNDDRLFCLTSRWNERVDGYIDRSLTDAREMDTASDVRSFLKNKAQAKRREADRHPDMLVEAACFEYLSSAGEKAFLKAWEMDKNDREGCRHI